MIAGALGWIRADFKQHVRRLKELGLTISLDVGYRLSPRGAAYLAAVQDRDSGSPPKRRPRSPMSSPGARLAEPRGAAAEQPR